MIELFKSIGLKSDPFTTSPNVEKFYPATEHRQCLEGLELSVRLRTVSYTHLRAHETR